MNIPTKKDYIVYMTNPETDEEFVVLIKQVYGHEQAIEEARDSQPHCTAHKSQRVHKTH